MIRILSFDPGEKNFAFSVTEHRINHYLQSRCIDCGHIQNTITNLKDSLVYNEQARAFIEEIRSFFIQYEIDHVVLERFMGRGVKVGTTSETTNIMIGLITQAVWEQSKDLTLVSAATWKNAYNKVRQDSLSTKNLKEEYKLIGTTPHQLDASLIGVYWASHEFDESPFKVYKDDSVRNRFMDSIESHSRIKLVNRKVKR